MNETTPYATPNANVADSAGEYGEINILSIAGRLGRVRYFVYLVGINLAISLIAMLLMALLGGGMAAMSTSGMDPSAASAGMGIGGSLVMLLFYLAAFVVTIMLSVQRLHDLDKTGWLYLLILIPFLNFFFALYLLFAPGTAGPNRYGPPPPPNSSGVVIAAWALGLIYLAAIAMMTITFSALMNAGGSL